MAKKLSLSRITHGIYILIRDPRNRKTKCLSVYGGNVQEIYKFIKKAIKMGGK